jgi:hypothetical protein
MKVSRLGWGRPSYLLMKKTNLAIIQNHLKSLALLLTDKEYDLEVKWHV